MIVMILERVPTGLRGELSRWLLEPQSGVFVGHVSARVRDRLWQKCCKGKKAGSVLQVWSTNNEQRFQMRSYGRTSRRLLDVEGVQLIQIPHDLDELAKGSIVKKRLSHLQKSAISGKDQQKKR